MVLLGDEAQVDAYFDLFGDSTNLDGRWVYVCAERTTVLEIILDAPIGTPRWLTWNLISVRSEIVLVSEQDRCTVCAKCTRNHFGRT
jgi:hypothetical protein